RTRVYSSLWVTIRAMPVCVAFIRGINVGGKNMLPMAMLRELCEGLGLRDVRTHIQSGNVVFRCSKAAELEKRLEDAIEKKSGFRPAVVVRAAEALRAAM